MAQRMWRQEKSHRNQCLSDSNLISPVRVQLHHTASSVACTSQGRHWQTGTSHFPPSFCPPALSLLAISIFSPLLCYSSAHFLGARAGGEVLAKNAPICLLLHLAFVGTPLHPKCPKRLGLFSKGKFLYCLLDVDIRKHNTTGFAHATSFLSTMAPSN